MMWTMLIIAVTGGAISSQAAFQVVSFQNKEACLSAASVFRKGSSKSIGYVCVSSETGEVVKFIAE
jgi:hypothetical protein